MTGPGPMDTHYLNRTLVVALGFSLLFAVIFSRLVFLQTVKHEYYLEKAVSQHHKRVKITPVRGSIYSATDQLLAVSMLRESAYMAPEFLRGEIDDPQRIRSLSRELAERLFESDSTTETLRRQAEIIKKDAESIERRLMSGSSLELKGYLDADTEIVFAGRVDGVGNAELSGEIEGREIELSGRMDVDEPVVLKGRGPDGDAIELKGNMSTSRRVHVEGMLREGLPIVRLKGEVARRRDFILKRKLPEPKVFELVAFVQEIGLPRSAIYFVQEGKRFYPNDSLASHVLGYTTTDRYGDNQGLAGIEGSYDEFLSGKPTQDIVETTSFLQGISPVGDDTLTSATGNSLFLTINEAIQNYAEEALAAQVEELGGVDGACVVMDVRSGGVLAMASYPTFNPNDRRGVSMDQLRNRCIVDSIPPGSVMKIFTLTTLLERNLVSPYEFIDCERGRYVFQNGRRRRTILDSHPLGEVSVHEAFAESSNVAFVKLGLRIPPADFSEQLQRFGFGDSTGLGLTGEGSGILHPVSRWNWDSRVSLAFGYELTLTPIQVAAAVAAIANEGRYMQPHVVREIRSARDELIFRQEPKMLRRVCSPQTSRIVMSMMEEVVNNGTGALAALPGYRVGGKTGTTVKTDRLASDDDSGKRYIGSFVGVLPVEDPQVVIYVWINEPTEAKYGSTVAAPVFRRIAEHTTRILALEPSRTVAPDIDAEDISSVEGREEGEAILALPNQSPALPAAPGVMPDLQGLTMREAVSTLVARGIDAQLVGGGVVVRQQPLAGQPVGDARCLVVFGDAYPE